MISKLRANLTLNTQMNKTTVDEACTLSTWDYQLSALLWGFTMWDWGTLQKRYNLLEIWLASSLWDDVSMSVCDTLPVAYGVSPGVLPCSLSKCIFLPSADIRCPSASTRNSISGLTLPAWRSWRHGNVLWLNGSKIFSSAPESQSITHNHCPFFWMRLFYLTRNPRPWVL